MTDQVTELNTGIKLVRVVKTLVPRPGFDDAPALFINSEECEYWIVSVARGGVVYNHGEYRNCKRV